MQGLEVSAMIEWTIDKNGEGPMKAFMNLGSDLASQIPKTANSMLSDMACSILRNYMANCTIDDVLKNREQMREKIIGEMSVVVKGWGVHLETVEVTDVRICSGTLFKNMQTKFREQNRKTATLQKDQVDNEIEEETLKFDTEQQKRNADTNKTKRFRDLAGEIAQKKRENEDYTKKLKLDKQAYERRLAEAKNLQARNKENSKLEQAIEVDKYKAEIATKILNFKNSRAQDENTHKIKLEQIKSQIEVADIKAADAREQVKQDYDLKKEKVADANQLQMLKLQTVKDIHATGSFGSVSLNSSDEKEPIYGLIDKFIAMTSTKN